MPEDDGPDGHVSGPDEESLAAAWQERFRILAQASGAIVWVAPPSGRGDEGVRPWAEFTGQSTSEVRDEGWATAIHPDERATISAQWYRAAEAREPFVSTYRVRRHDGLYRSLRLRVVPRLDDGGEIVEWVGLATDETERLAAEAASRRSERLLRAAVEGAPIVLFAMDRSGLLTVCEGKLSRDDAGPAGLAGAPATELFPGDPAWADALRRGLAGEAVTWEGWADGASLVVHLLPVLDDAGEPAGAAGAAFDNSALRHAEAALRTSEERYRALAETSPDFIFVVDPDHLVRYVNARASRAFGRSPEELVGLPVHELFDAGVAARMAKHLARVFESGEILKVDGEWTRPEGSIWLSTWLVPQKAADGSVRAVFGASRDITERKAAEQEIRHLNAELERRIVTRTRQLDAVNKELEAFAYSAAHDLRAPLRAIDGFSAMVMEDAAGRLTPEDEHHLQRVRAAAQRMSQLIDDILGLSRLSRVDMKLEIVDLSAMALAVCEELRSENPQREVQTTIEPGLVVQADPGLLRVILRDLLENAWKFTTKHERALVELGAVDVDGETAIFVRDDGAGFDPRHAGHLFGAFQRLHRADEFEGDGIGLATVQRLVNRHGGRVWAEGEIEKGAVVYFTIPGP